MIMHEFRRWLWPPYCFAELLFLCPGQGRRAAVVSPPSKKGVFCMVEPILQIDGLAKSYGIHQIFTGVSFILKAGEKVALVGPNGIGKSTVLKILANMEEPDEGRVVRSQEPLLCHYVPQMPTFPDSTVWSVLLREKKRLGLLARGTPEEAIKRFGLGGAEAHLASEHLSGGQKTRLALAVAWLSQPDLLLLDEPTNHLDMAALEWLEEYVRSYPGSVLVVSHDRVFLDRIVSRVLELGKDGITEYLGDYTEYQKSKIEAFAQAMNQYQAEQKRIKKLEAAIDQQMRRFEQSHRTAGQHDFYRSKAKKIAKAAKAHMTRLEAMKASSSAKPQIEKGIALGGFGSTESGRRLVIAENLAKSYGKTLFTHGNFSVLKGDKIALVGSNGAGKTTILKMVLGREAPSNGSLWVSPSASVGYLDQEIDELGTDRTVLNEVLQVLPRKTSDEITRARTLLARLLFGAEDLEKSIGVLSVGERKRVALAKLLLSSYNLLLLDEPADHLDLPSREQLEEALLAYDGTFVLVSHDRYLLRKVCNKVIAIGDGRIRTYPGGFANYEARKASCRLPKEGAAQEDLSSEKRLLLEIRLAQLSADLAIVPKEDPRYEEAEKEFLAIARILRS